MTLLFDHINSTLIPAAAAAAAGDVELYSAYNATTLVMTRNPSCWQTFDRTGISAKATTGSFPISAQHFIVPNHTSGDQSPHYWDEAGTRYDRNISGSPVRIGTTDSRVCLYNSLLPAGVKPFKILPPDWRRWLKFNGKGLAAWKINQFGKIAFGFITQLGSSEQFVFNDSTDPAYANVTIPSIGGDSGWLIGTTINGEPVALGGLFTASGGVVTGAFLSDVAADTNAIIESQSPGEGYALSYVDLSPFSEAAVTTGSFTLTAIASNTGSATWDGEPTALAAVVANGGGMGVVTSETSAITFTLTQSVPTTAIYNVGVAFNYDATDLDGGGGETLVVEFLDAGGNPIALLGAEIGLNANDSFSGALVSTTSTSGPLASVASLRITAGGGVDAMAALWAVRNLTATYEYVAAATPAPATPPKLKLGGLSL